MLCSVTALVIAATFSFPQVIAANVFKSIFASNDSGLGTDSERSPLSFQSAAVLKATTSVGGGDLPNFKFKNISSDGLMSPIITASGDVTDWGDGLNSHGTISLYEVKSGDSLASISTMFDVSVDTIVWANTDVLNGRRSVKEGQKLVILPISGVKHKVLKGESLKSIALKYKTPVEEISLFNNLDSDSLESGQILIIPGGEIPKIINGANSVNRNKTNPSAKDVVGYFIRPLVGGRKSQGIHGFNAVDIASPLGTSVFASASGNVIVAKDNGWNGGYGNYVVISHSNGTQTLYAHLNQVSVSSGENVFQGQVIGTVGSTGRSTGSHLHFEIRGAKNPF